MLLVIFKVSGHSMQPTIRNGEAVLVSGIPFLFSKPKIGDIVAFKKNGKVFVKRIIEIDNDRYFLTGDNEGDSMDSRVFGSIERREIMGKVVYKISNVKNQISNLYPKS